MNVYTKRYRARYRPTLTQVKMSLKKDARASAVLKFKTSESLLNIPLAEAIQASL